MTALLVACAVAALAAPAAPSSSSFLSSPAMATRVVTVRDSRIAESSGLVASGTHPGLVWTVNDSGSGPVIYGVSTRSGRTSAVLTMSGIDARDMEAMTAGQDAAGRSWLWVGDIGDNRAVLDSVVLRLLREPTAVRSQSVPVRSLRLRYPDGPADAEALIWTPSGHLLVITKGLFSTRVYEVPPPAVAAALAGHSVTTPAVAQRFGTIGQRLVTDGAALPDGRIVVRDYESAVVYSLGAAGLKEAAHLPLPSQPQGETLAAEPSGTSVLVGSEGRSQPLWRVPMSEAKPLNAPASSTRSVAAQPLPQPDRSQSRALGWGLAALAVAVLGGVAVLVTRGGAGLRGARRRSRRTR